MDYWEGGWRAAKGMLVPLSNYLSNFCVCPSFPFSIEGGMWDVIVLIPDHCLCIYSSW